MGEREPHRHMSRSLDDSSGPLILRAELLVHLGVAFLRPETALGAMRRERDADDDGLPLAAKRIATCRTEKDKSNTSVDALKGRDPI